MCDPITLAVAATGLSATSSVLGGMQQSAMMKGQAAQANADADAEKGAAMVRAEKIRKMTKSNAASARAALAASGVSLDSQTSTMINQDILKRGEEDAQVNINDATDTASRLRASARSLKSSARQAVIGGIASGVGSVLQTGAAIKSGWYGTTASAE